MSKQGKQGISWTDETWNPMIGCSKVSPGCDNCWSAKAAWLHYHHAWDGNIRLFPERLEQPLHWRKPRKIAVCLMGDLFHQSIQFEFIDEVFATMACSYWHTFQILTKRPNQMLKYLTEYASGGRHIWQAGQFIEMPRGIDKPSTGWPLPNVWLGVSCENQAAADERIGILLDIPAAVRFISCEPLLERVDLYPWIGRNEKHGYGSGSGIHWVIVGGESGPHARAMNADWVRLIRDQCQKAGVPLHFKQWGEYGPNSPGCMNDTAYPYERWGKKAAGRMLDGREWQEFPGGK